MAEYKILDLDVPETYAHNFTHILNNNSLWPALSDDFEGTRFIYNDLGSKPEYVKHPVAKDLQDRCAEELRRCYSHVMAYHSCLTDDPKQYHQAGLLSASPEWLHTMAKKIFDGISGLDEALLEADKKYLNVYKGSLSFYISGKFAATEYLNKGSLYLRHVEAELGLAGEKRLLDSYKHRKPVFVKCKVPVSWLEDPVIAKDYTWLHPYTAGVTRRCIWAKVNKEKEYWENPDAFTIFSAISSANVESIIGAESCVNWPKKS